MSQGTSNAIPIWDLAVRVFHWSLVVCFAVAYITSEDGGEVHEFAGYAVLALVSLRLLWGFIGGEYARFTEFVRSPAVVIEYLKSARAGNPKHYLGHNPLGGYMVVALLVMLFVITLSGLQLEEVKEQQAKLHPAATVALDGVTEHEHSHADSPEESLWENIHEIATDLTLGLIALHILGVISSSRLHKENLVKAMITGKKYR